MKIVYTSLTSLLLLSGCIDFFGGSRENDKVEILQEEKSPNGRLHIMECEPPEGR